ncbi:hypothetical protein OSCI_3460004 [Kamptonema sp. PCC 6506]|nr:hypothetical protein OSCI_3460004 [Kamptonema sp. PCC 6506]
MRFQELILVGKLGFQMSFLFKILGEELTATTAMIANRLVF